MDGLRSTSHNNNEKPSMQLDNSYNNNYSGLQDMRSYSASNASSAAGRMDMEVATAAEGGGEQWKFKKGKSTNGVDSKSWSFSEPDLVRKRRIASYKAYTVEGKMKGSIKKSFKWLRQRYTLLVYGHK